MGQPHFEVLAHREKSSTVPAVTVAISLYNCRNLIRECLESVRLQTISDVDLIIVDDCSSDGSP